MPGGQRESAPWAWAVVASALWIHAQASSDYPACVLSDKMPRKREPVFADVTRYIKHADEVRHRVSTFTSSSDVGMGLSKDPHDLGEIVDQVVPGSQAEAAGVQKGWIIKAVDGKPFSPKERLADVVKDFASARKADSTLTVKFDVRTSLDCAKGNCKNSDQFPTESKEDCAEACHRSEQCEWWYLHKEDADSVCSLSRNVLGYGSEAGSATGSRTCLPEAVRGWPHCVIVDAKLPASSDVVRADVRSLVGTVDPKGCANQDCKNTDTFWVPSQAECAEACFKVPECNFWSITMSGTQSVCWLRSSNLTRVAEPSAAFASKDCRPNAQGGQRRFLLIGGLFFVAAWIARDQFVKQFPLVGVIGEVVTTSLQRTMGIAPKKLDSSVRHLRHRGDDNNSELQSLIGEQATERMQIPGQGYF